MPKKLIQESLKIQKQLIKRIKSCKKPRTIKVEDKEIIILPKVFPPATDSILLVKTVKFKSGDVVLDACSGSGIYTIFAGDKAKKIIATDISKYAIKNIRENVKLHNLEDKVTVIQSDIFPKSKIKFDIILINPPYTDKKAKDVVEKTVWDEGHKTVNKFFQSAKQFLKENGKIYLSWANFADLSFIENLAKKAGYEIKRVAKATKNNRVYIIYEIKSRRLRHTTR